MDETDLRMEPLYTDEIVEEFVGGKSWAKAPSKAGLIRYKVTCSEDTLTLTSGGTSAIYRHH